MSTLAGTTSANALRDLSRSPPPLVGKSHSCSVDLTHRAPRSASSPPRVDTNDKARPRTLATASPRPEMPTTHIRRRKRNPGSNASSRNTKFEKTPTQRRSSTVRPSRGHRRPQASHKHTHARALFVPPTARTLVASAWSHDIDR